jgi:hypothetical protein
VTESSALSVKAGQPHPRRLAAQRVERRTATPIFGLDVGWMSGLLANIGWLVQLEVGDHAVMVAGHDLTNGLVQDAPAIGDVQGGAVVAAAHQHIVDAPAPIQIRLVDGAQEVSGLEGQPGVAAVDALPAVSVAVLMLSRDLRPVQNRMLEVSGVALKSPPTITCAGSPATSSSMRRTTATACSSRSCSAHHAQELPWQATSSRPSGSGAATSAMTAPQL